MQQCTDDSNYTGEYARGKRHGAGVYSFPNGDAYSGQYEHDLPQVGGARGASTRCVVTDWGGVCAVGSQRPNTQWAEGGQ